MSRVYRIIIVAFVSVIRLFPPAFCCSPASSVCLLDRQKMFNTVLGARQNALNTDFGYQTKRGVKQNFDTRRKFYFLTGSDTGSDLIFQTRRLDLTFWCCWQNVGTI